MGPRAGLDVLEIKNLLGEAISTQFRIFKHCVADNKQGQGK
jgi:hypothetical protein